MNYRHHFHAGNFADVTKHVVLRSLFAGLQKKEKGFFYLDTHAGRGRYDLEAAGQGDTLPRAPEWPDGFGRLAATEPPHPVVADYIAAVKSFDRRSGNLGVGVRFYPGSPWLAREWVRGQDRMALCELHPGEASALAAAFSGEDGVRVHTMDGYVALRAMLPPPEKRALVLIDPPFESPSEWSDMIQAIAEGLRRLPGGTFAVWYPLTERANIDRFCDELIRLSPPPTWTAEVSIAPESAGLKMRGCGVLVVNPPWSLDRELKPVLSWLARVLEQEQGSMGTLQWLVPER